MAARNAVGCLLQHECEHIAESVWRIPLNAQCTGTPVGVGYYQNIDHNILHFFKLPSKSIISLLLMDYRIFLCVFEQPTVSICNPVGI